MHKVDSNEAMKLVIDGKIISTGDRYLKLDAETNKLRYSDDLKNWSESRITVNQFFNWDNWYLVEGE